MKALRITLCTAALAGAALVLPAGVAGATVTPTTGQPGAPGFTCDPSGSQAPGNSGSANGSPFNPAGQAGNVYAGNPNTASSNNSNSSAAVSQYDIACLQTSGH
jgi:hypothetical protein